jgi:hypothetical protein
LKYFLLRKQEQIPIFSHGWKKIENFFIKKFITTTYNSIRKQQIILKNAQEIDETSDKDSDEAKSIVYEYMSI